MKVVWTVMIAIVVLCVIVFGVKYLEYKAQQTARDKLILEIKGFCSSAQAWYRDSAMNGGGGERFSVEGTPREITSDDISMIIGRIDPTAEAHVVTTATGTYEFIPEGDRLIVRGTAVIDQRIKSKGEIVLGEEGIILVEVLN